MATYIAVAGGKKGRHRRTQSSSSANLLDANPEFIPGPDQQSQPNGINSIKISSKHKQGPVPETKVPPDGKLSKKHGVNVIAVKQDGSSTDVNPTDVSKDDGDNVSLVSLVKVGNPPERESSGPEDNSDYPSDYQNGYDDYPPEEYNDDLDARDISRVDVIRNEKSTGDKKKAVPIIDVQEMVKRQNTLKRWTTNAALKPNDADPVPQPSVPEKDKFQGVIIYDIPKTGPPPKPVPYRQFPPEEPKQTRKDKISPSKKENKRPTEKVEKKRPPKIKIPERPVEKPIEKPVEKPIEKPVESEEEQSDDQEIHEETPPPSPIDSDPLYDPLYSVPKKSKGVQAKLAPKTKKPSVRYQPERDVSPYQDDTNGYPEVERIYPDLPRRPLKDSSTQTTTDVATQTRNLSDIEQEINEMEDEVANLYHEIRNVEKDPRKSKKKLKEEAERKRLKKKEKQEREERERQEREREEREREERRREEREMRERRKEEKERKRQEREQEEREEREREERRKKDQLEREARERERREREEREREERRKEEQLEREARERERREKERERRAREREEKEKEAREREEREKQEREEQEKRERQEREEDEREREERERQERFEERDRQRRIDEQDLEDRILEGKGRLDRTNSTRSNRSVPEVLKPRSELRKQIEPDTITPDNISDAEMSDTSSNGSRSGRRKKEPEYVPNPPPILNSVKDSDSSTVEESDDEDLASKNEKKREMKRLKRLDEVKKPVIFPTDVYDEKPVPALTNLRERPQLLGVFSIKTYSSHPRAKCRPTGLAISPSGNYIITDYADKAVKVFNKSGQVKAEFEADSIVKPWGVCLLKDGNVAVSDPGDTSVKMFTRKGKFIKKFEFANLVEPYGITISNAGDILVTDKGANGLYVFNSDGHLKGSLGKSTNNNNPIAEWPQYVAVDGSDNIIISDYMAHCIKILSPSGSLVKEHGSMGVGTGQLMCPQGICVDAYGHIIVADNINSRVKILSPNGEFIRELVTRKEGIEGPEAVAIDHDGNLVITEANTGNVKIFSYVM